MSDILSLLKKVGSSDVFESEDKNASYNGNCNCGGGGNCTHCNCTHCSVR